MRLAVNIGYWGSRSGLDMELVMEAERLGYHSVWAAEAWGSDAITVLSWIAARTRHIHVGSAILQIPARTPAMTAMTATTLNELSGGRFHLGLGVSGPQVVEGWHGRPYTHPLTRTREYLAIVRKAVAREQPLTHDGEHYQIPYRGPGATGLGRPLTLTTRPGHPLPVYLAALGPRNIALAAEIADGWLPLFFSPHRAAEVFQPHLDTGFAASGEPDKAARFDVAPTVPAVVTSDPERARQRLKPMLALYLGGMGARDRNFYHQLACRYGYEAEADRVQTLYLDGKRRRAAAAVPDALVDEIGLIGPEAKIADRLGAWREAGATTLLIDAPDRATLRALTMLV